jgi:Family of unknown function (DUF6166)
MSKGKIVPVRQGRTASPAKSVKRYEGIRSHGEVFVKVNGRALDPRFDLRFHSPNGFEWGYGGSGPAQLSLALLADHLQSDERALALYQDFKRAVVSGLAHECWWLTADEIEHVLESIATV